MKSVPRHQKNHDVLSRRQQAGRISQPRNTKLRLHKGGVGVAPYRGEAHVAEWSSTTRDNGSALNAAQLVGGRGPVVRDTAVQQAIEDTRAFLRTTLEGPRAVRDRQGTLKEAFDDVHAKLAPRYAGFPIFEHTMPFNVQRTWDELDGIDHPRIWTAERDREVWDALQD